ncbi:bile acid:sodium symporter family protein [Cyclobacterium marinum]|uniref:Bile acid:sodium symporter n=1 Tax=Cyclobacterium marinum (strain ATCC 25205 / DSM 745 / LMG 13164 / NCIMB 1802) TaxID=880070 RepID=G0IZR8_CYCMS|nr:bile acid:sodium symporter family protein [Cyclobacterium marinum]AEL25732.1 Bile acid:sodium symporter [Cyclobacterium marinum DSM 745]
MKKQVLFRSILLLAILLLLIYLYLIFSGIHEPSGPFLIGFMVLLGIAFSINNKLKGYTYTIMIFCSATIALYFPLPFISYKGYALSQLITPLIQFIMFGMGTAMSVKDFIQIGKNPKGVFIGLVCQLSLMPLSGWAIAHFSGLPVEIAAGIILVGCSPSGVASNVISYLAKANLALSITITALSTLLAPFATPFLMKWLAGSMIEINVGVMMWSIVKMVIIPIGAGLLINHLFRNKIAFLQKVMPTLSMAVVAIVIVLITASGRDNLLDIGFILLGLVLLHNIAGYLLGYTASKTLGLDERDSRTIALEVGLQNGGMAGALAKEMGKLATLGLAPAVFSIIMNISGSILASYWHKNEPK